MLPMDTAPHDGSQICLYFSWEESGARVAGSEVVYWRSAPFDARAIDGSPGQYGFSVSGLGWLVARHYDGWDKPGACATGKEPVT